MRLVTAHWIADAVGGTLAADPEVEVTSVEKDSRAVTPGALYVAFSGERADGHSFVSAAVAAGASLCLVSQAVDAPHILVEDTVIAIGRLARAYLELLRSEGDLTVIGITGSNGKTSTKDLLSLTLRDVVAPVGSFNNEIGLPLTVLRAGNDTRNLVLEMGASQPGDIAYLTEIAPLDVAVILTVGSAHVEFYPSPDALAAEKASILDGLIEGGRAVFNIDDPRVAAMADDAEARTMGAWIIRCGFSPGADVQGSNLRVESGRAKFDVSYAGSDASVALTLVGEHHATNALAALAAGIVVGVAPSTAAPIISAARPLSPHRMALTERADGVHILDDSYNASPESMRAALRALLDVAEGGRTWAVIGEMREMGDASWQAHSSIGVDVVRLNISRLVVVGEGAKPAFDSAVREGSWGEEAVYLATIDEAQALLDAELEPGDTVLVKASHGANLWQVADHLVEGRA